MVLFTFLTTQNYYFNPSSSFIYVLLKIVL